MSDQRPIINIVTDIQQIIDDLTAYPDTFSVSLELAHQLLEEVTNTADDYDLL